MTTMLDSYLSFTRGEITDPIEEINLKYFLKDIVNNLKNENSKIDLMIIKESISSGRPAQLRRCLVNIIENAKRYSDFIKIILDKKNEEIQMIVEDNGPGIPEKHFKDVFRPFYSLDKSRNKLKGSSGLGMTISRDIARSHGGDIELGRSSIGGLKVIITIPI